MRYALLIITLILSFAAVGLAHTVTFQPDGDASKDTGIWEYAPDKNYGDYSYFWLGYNYDCWAYSLIKFNGLDTYMGVTVVSATLSLFAYYEWGSLQTDNWVARVDGDWEENTVTWNNSPGWNADMFVYFDTVPVAQWLNLDVTAMVASWMDGSFPHNGFFIGAGIPYEGGKWFHSGECVAVPSLRPKLTLEYSGVDVQPTSLGEVKAIFN